MITDVNALVGATGEAERLLRRYFCHTRPPTPDTRAARIRPHPEDFVALFGARAEEVELAYASLWERPALPAPKPGQTELRVAVANAGLLVADHELSRRFPGGFREIAASLPEDSVWATWRYLAPGEVAGMSYDGLCQREDGRWAWFPKLWRVLR